MRLKWVTPPSPYLGCSSTCDRSAAAIDSRRSSTKPAGGRVRAARLPCVSAPDPTRRCGGPTKTGPMPIAQPFPFPALIADVGGTNARFAVVSEAGGALQSLGSVRTGDFPDFAAAARQVLATAGAAAPRSLLVDGAGPVVGNEIKLTNADWRLVIDDIGRSCGSASPCCSTTSRRCRYRCRSCRRMASDGSASTVPARPVQRWWSDLALSWRHHVGRGRRPFRAGPLGSRHD